MQYHHNEIACTKCGVLLDVAERPDGSFVLPRPPHVKDGMLQNSISICIKCRHIMVYDNDAGGKLIFRELTLKEAQDLRGNEEVIAALMSVLSNERALGIYARRKKP